MTGKDKITSQWIEPIKSEPMDFERSYDVGDPTFKPYGFGPWRRQSPPNSGLTAASAISFVFCLNNGGWDDELIPNKIYPVLSPIGNFVDAWTRIIDENGEDMMYRNELFIEVDLPEIAKECVRHFCIAA